MPTEDDFPWFIPSRKMLLGDGSTLVKPLKAVQWADSPRVVAWTGVKRKTLHALAECGLIRCRKPSPHVRQYLPAEVQEFLERTEREPGFWNEVRTKAFLRGERLKEAVPRE